MKKLWTVDEEAALRAAWPTDDVAKLAEQLGRSVIAIEARVLLLGLNIGQRRYGSRAKLDAGNS